MPVTLDKGHYTLIYASGEYRTLRVRPMTQGNFKGTTIISYKEGNHYYGFGFLNGNQVHFWKRFRDANPVERLARMQKAVNVIVAEPRAAQQAFAMKEGRCARCGRQLTVPASLNHGLGPECAGKVRWAKADQLVAFEAQKKSAA